MRSRLTLILVVAFVATNLAPPILWLLNGRSLGELVNGVLLGAAALWLVTPVLVVSIYIVTQWFPRSLETARWIERAFGLVLFFESVLSIGVSVVLLSSPDDSVLIRFCNVLTCCFLLAAPAVTFTFGQKIVEEVNERAYEQYLAADKALALAGVACSFAQRDTKGQLLRTLAELEQLLSTARSIADPGHRWTLG